MTLFRVISPPRRSTSSYSKKSALKPFIDHLARDRANAINTFVRDDLEPNTSNMSGNAGSGQGGGVVAYTHYGDQAGISYYESAQGYVGYGGQVKEETVDSGPPQGGQGQQQGASGQQGGQVQQAGNNSYGYGYGGNYNPYR